MCGGVIWAVYLQCLLRRLAWGVRDFAFMPLLVCYKTERASSMIK